jgi:phage baseplate assembly protein V
MSASTIADRLYRRIRMAIASVTITATDDSGPVHKVQAKVRGTPETIDNLQTLNLYGFASHAPNGSDALALFGNGDRSNGVIVATANQAARPRNQKQGEVTIYTDEGDVISLQRNHTIAITTTGTLSISAPTLNLSGKDGGKVTVNLAGDIIASGTITADTINAPHGHVGP